MSEQDEIRRLEAENARLREALKPFVDEAGEDRGYFPDSQSLYFGVLDGGAPTRLTVGDLRRAAEVLKP
jgi:hypothetical protein